MKSGWLLPYLLVGDFLYTKRWTWWLNCLLKEEIKPPIPELRLREDAETRKMLNKCIEYLESRGKDFEDFVDWMLWSLGLSEEKPNLSKQELEFLYRNFVLGMLQENPWDYFGEIAAEKRRGEFGFFPTPPDLAEFMATCLAQDNNIFQKIIDPCAGTGVLLMAYSNYSVNLFAIDINPFMIKLIKINAALYIPWLLLPVEVKNEREYSIPQKIKEVARELKNLQYIAFKELEEFSSQKTKTQPKKPVQLRIGF
ncbi:MAG: hypothetical protein DSY42_05990 [Aquifex sp.]|nr:MAG: hypothetical protein DSY42_05990 [Aquifex sp.]